MVLTVRRSPRPGGLTRGRTGERAEDARPRGRHLGIGAALGVPLDRDEPAARRVLERLDEPVDPRGRDETRCEALRIHGLMVTRVDAERLGPAGLSELRPGGGYGDVLEDRTVL